jgi:hypothetical protein
VTDADSDGIVQPMTARETWRELARTVAWLQAHGRSALDGRQAVEEAVQDWLGAQWAEHNRGAPMSAPDGEPGDGVVERFWPMVNKPESLSRRRKR